MELIKIKSTKSGNCGCFNCNKFQEGLKMQPITLWRKEETENRGTQLPMCSVECAREYINKNIKDYKII